MKAEEYNRVCEDCKYLIFAGEFEHECPSEEYLKQRNQMISDACEAEERYGIEYLEDMNESKMV